MEGIFVKKQLDYFWNNSVIILPQLVTTYRAFYGTRMFITTFTTVYRLSISWHEHQKISMPQWPAKAIMTE